jgi:quinol monooxygenase YgiN
VYLHRKGKVYTLLKENEQSRNPLALLVILEAKQGREAEVETFLQSALRLVMQEQGTTQWYAFRISPSKFGIFDTFPDEEGRNAHLTGELAQALFAKAEELLAAPPQVEKPAILAAKTAAA